MWRTARSIWIIFPEHESRYGGGGGDEGDEAQGNDHLTSINPISTRNVWSLFCWILVRSKVEPPPIDQNIPTHDRGPRRQVNGENGHVTTFILMSLFCKSTALRRGVLFSWRSVCIHGRHKSLQKCHYRSCRITLEDEPGARVTWEEKHRNEPPQQRSADKRIN